MRSSNLARALAELAETDTVHYVDTETGQTFQVSLEEHARLLPVLPARVKVRATEMQARALSAKIRNRN